MPTDGTYTILVQPSAVAGDIIVAGFFGSAITAPGSWTSVASGGNLSIFKYSVQQSDLGINQSFSFTWGSASKAALFVVHVNGATGVTGRIVISPSAVSSVPFVVSITAAPLIWVGCFSATSQAWATTVGASAEVFGQPLAYQGCPGVIQCSAQSGAALTFSASLATIATAFELDFAGTSPTVYASNLAHLA